MLVDVGRGRLHPSLYANTNLEECELNSHDLRSLRGTNSPDTFRVARIGLRVIWGLNLDRRISGYKLSAAITYRKQGRSFVVEGDTPT